MRIKVEAVIELDDELWPLKDEDEIDWLKQILSDRENLVLMLWSNDIGDELGSTKQFSYTLIETTEPLTPKL